MPLDQASLEKKDELYRSVPEKSDRAEMPKRNLEVVPPKGVEDGAFHEEEVIRKIEAREKPETLTEIESAAESQSKTIEQHGAEILTLINNIPEGGNIDLEQVEKKCAEIVKFVIGENEKSPQKVKDELIAFAEKYFENNSSIGFIITELFRIANPILSKKGY